MDTHDKLIDIDEAARLLCTSKDFLYRHHKTLPFTVRLSERQLRFSFVGILQWIATKQEAQHGRTRV